MVKDLRGEHTLLKFIKWKCGAKRHEYLKS
jgi:hypothetical protein